MTIKCLENFSLYGLYNIRQSDSIYLSRAHTHTRTHSCCMAGNACVRTLCAPEVGQI